MTLFTLSATLHETSTNVAGNLNHNNTMYITSILPGVDLLPILLILLSLLMQKHQALLMSLVLSIGQVIMFLHLLSISAHAQLL